MSFSTYSVLESEGEAVGSMGMYGLAFLVAFGFVEVYFFFSPSSVPWGILGLHPNMVVFLTVFLVLCSKGVTLFGLMLVLFLCVCACTFLLWLCDACENCILWCGAHTAFIFFPVGHWNSTLLWYFAFLHCPTTQTTLVKQ